MQERQTKQKQIIYEALQTLNHPTATEVYGWVQEVQPSVSRATVFRVLGGFAASGRAQELRLAGSEVRYDYRTEGHCHGRCTGCGKVVDVEIEDGAKGFSKVKAENDFSIEGYNIEFFGRCEGCAEGK